MAAFSAQVLDYDAEAEAARICQTLRTTLQRLRRRGAVVALSGGIDSSVVGALCTRALGPQRVHGLLMPERDSADETLGLSQTVVETLGISATHEDITPALTALRCYERRDEAIRSVVPEYTSEYKAKIVLPSATEQSSYNIYSVVVRSPSGDERRVRLTPAAYLGIVAATNFKQRIRKLLEYYHADRLNYAVAGTPNRLEFDQGFFVKAGDGAADFKPIAHLYKTQVYQMARHLGMPEEICSRAPTTDTYTLEQGQDEFYFALPYAKMDLCLYGKNNGFSPDEVAPAVGLSAEQVAWVYDDIEKKRETTKYLHASAVLVDPVEEIDATIR